MWNYFITIAISIIIIYLLHQLWEYFKESYSTKRTKNIIGIQTEKYKKIIEDLSHRNSLEGSIEDPNDSADLEAFMNKIVNETI